ncbi:MAG TPA: ABC transporter substrate-binding protein [Azospirillum sp.]
MPITRHATRLARAAALASALAIPAVGSAAAEQISVTHWGVLMYGAPYAVAMEKGYFKEAGVDIDGILTSKGGGTTMRNVMAGGLPYGEVALSAAIAAAQQGIDVRIVNAGVQTVGEILWVTTKDSPVKTIADLQGKKLGFTSPKSITDILSQMALEKSGIPENKVQRVSVGGIGSGLTALQQGGVQAVPIMDPVWAKEKDKYRAVFWVKDLVPPMTQTVGVTTTEFAEKNPDKLRALISARRKGVEFIHANPAEAAAIVAKAYNMEPAIAEESMKNLQELDYWSTGAFDREGLENMAEGLRKVGEIKGEVAWDTLLDERFLGSEPSVAEQPAAKQ